MVLRSCNRFDLCDPSWSLNPVLEPMPLQDTTGAAANTDGDAGSSCPLSDPCRLVHVHSVNPDAQTWFDPPGLIARDARPPPLSGVQAPASRAASDRSDRPKNGSGSHLPRTVGEKAAGGNKRGRRGRAAAPAAAEAPVEEIVDTLAPARGSGGLAPLNTNTAAPTAISTAAEASSRPPPGTAPAAPLPKSAYASCPPVRGSAARAMAKMRTEARASKTVGVDKTDRPASLKGSTNAALGGGAKERGRRLAAASGPKGASPVLSPVVLNHNAPGDYAGRDVSGAQEVEDTKSAAAPSPPDGGHAGRRHGAKDGVVGKAIKGGGEPDGVPAAASAAPEASVTTGGSGVRARSAPSARSSSPSPSPSPSSLPAESGVPGQSRTSSATASTAPTLTPASATTPSMPKLIGPRRNPRGRWEGAEAPGYPSSSERTSAEAQADLRRDRGTREGSERVGRVSSGDAATTPGTGSSGGPNRGGRRPRPAGKALAREMSGSLREGAKGGGSARCVREAQPRAASEVTPVEGVGVGGMVGLDPRSIRGERPPRRRRGRQVTELTTRGSDARGEELLEM